MAISRKTGLGRGFEDLFSDTEIVEKEVDIRPKNKRKVDQEEGIVYIDINDIRPNETQPRKHFATEKISELAASIEKYGVIQPIMVRPSKIGYEIVAGERRWRAARQAGIKNIPAIIRELSEEQNMFVALIENVQREDLNPMEEAKAYGEMVEIYGMTQEKIAERMGKSRPYIANCLRLLKLPGEIQEYILKNLISQGHGKVLAGIKEANVQKKLAKTAAEKKLSVRELEKLILNSKETNKERALTKRKKTKSRELLAAEEELKIALGTKVTINGNGKKGNISIEFYSREELERLFEMLKSMEEV